MPFVCTILPLPRNRRCDWTEAAVRCPLPGQRGFAQKLYCKAHAVQAAGGGARSPKAPMARLTRQKTRQYCTCGWAPCEARVKVRLPRRGGKMYCKRRAGKVRGDSDLIRTIDEHQDSKVPAHDAGTMDVPCLLCGALMFEGEEVGGATSKPHFHLCCRSGKLSDLRKVPFLPPVLQDLLAAGTAEAKEFRRRLREYKGALSFVSFGADCAPPPGRGPPAYRAPSTTRAASSLPRREDRRHLLPAVLV
jgi:hypothetical protein